MCFISCCNNVVCTIQCFFLFSKSPTQRVVAKQPPIVKVMSNEKELADCKKKLSTHERMLEKHRLVNLIMLSVTYMYSATLIIQYHILTMCYLMIFIAILMCVK